MAKALVISVALVLIPNSAFSAQKVTPGSTCKVINQKVTYLNKIFTCIKSGTKLVWIKGVVVVKPTPAPTPALSPAPTPTPTQVFYSPSDPTSIYRINDIEGCAVAFDSSGKEVTFATLWALKDGKWLQVKTKETGWEKTCNDSRLPNNKYFAFAKAAIDDGTQIRWKFVGQVNIRERDAQGNGYSQPIEFTAPPKPLEPLIPHPVEGGYGISWQNIVQRINDISAAAWTDAQLTLIRNADLPNAANRLTTYITPNAAKTDTKLDDVLVILKKTFTLFARIPAPSKIFFIAMTYDDVAQTKLAIKDLYSNSSFMIDSVVSIYEVKPDDPAATVFTFKGCDRWGYARNSYTWPNTREAGSLTLGVCPPDPGGDSHEIAVGVMDHEYVHLIQIGLKPNTSNTWENIPCWMIEGEPEFAQSAMSKDFSAYLKAQKFHPYLLSSSGRDYAETTAREWSSEEVLSYYLSAADSSTCRDTNKFAYSFSLGAATIEALVSIGGSESFFALHERLILGEKINDAFKTVYGITWDEAAPILAQVVAKKITLAWSDSALTYQTRPKN